MEKQLLIPSRVRQIPRQFSWVDQRLVQAHFIQRCSTEDLALYLFLLTVADAQGLSYWSNTVIARQLSVSSVQLANARETLIRADLIAYQAPLYQVLSLPQVTTESATIRSIVSPPLKHHRPTPEQRQANLAKWHAILQTLKEHGDD